ncbi:MAG: sn-glycerol-3-phosphate ABC transporter ATP-binding protein UgpC [Desulfarculaceae bacterium]|jgi:ABC-type sugar transport system ATPase subunit
MAYLSLRGISKRFGKVQALSQVSLEVAQGEFWVLLGPSGCGKSTLLHIVAGLIAQDEGEVWLKDQPLDRLTPRERDVAMVFQSYALYPHMTVAQNLSFGLRMRGVDRETISRRVAQTARLLGIEELLLRKPRALSGGQRQRVAMGRALVRRPSLFLLDEPLSNLDARLRASVRLELKQLHQQIQATMIYVTHDQVEAMTLGDQVAVIRAGEILQKGPPEEIYERPADTFVAKFIGSPEMNLFPGTAARREDKWFFQGDGFSLGLKEAGYLHEGMELALGLRPEDLMPEGAGPIRLEARVEMLSNVGSEKYIHARLGQGSITARASKEAGYAPGRRVRLAVDPNRLHLFHQGRRLSG